MDMWDDYFFWRFGEKQISCALCQAKTSHGEYEFLTETSDAMVWICDDCCDVLDSQVEWSADLDGRGVE